jgi:hypothetical protein
MYVRRTISFNKEGRLGVSMIFIWDSSPTPWSQFISGLQTNPSMYPVQMNLISTQQRKNRIFQKAVQGVVLLNLAIPDKKHGGVSEITWTPFGYGA